MASKAVPTGTAIRRGNRAHSSLGTLAPLNTPTRRFYGSQEHGLGQTSGISNPNIYVVQPFKNASLPKDLIYAKKNAPNPGEGLLNSTIDLINHFTSCYEAVKHQLQDEHIQGRENLSNGSPMTTNETHNGVSKCFMHRPAKQARLRPLILHRNQQSNGGNQGPSIEDCIGISPVPETKYDDLTKIYDEKLRLLRKLKPDLFDNQGNIISRNPTRTHSYSQASEPSSSKKSVISSFRTPHNTVLTAENIQSDERRTFLTEFTTEEEDKENSEDGTKTLPFTSNQQAHSLNEIMKNNYVLQVLEIKTMTGNSLKRDRTRSASDKGSFYSYKGNATVKST